MEFLFGLIAVAGLGAIFYVSVHRKTRDELKNHIQAAEVVIKEVQQAEEAVKELIAKTEEVVVEIAVESKAVVEEVVAEVKEVVAPVKAPKTPKAAVAEKRTRKGGKFVGDDKSTKEVNEAYKDGKKPEKVSKKPAKTTTPKASKPAVKKKVKPS